MTEADRDAADLDRVRELQCRIDELEAERDELLGIIGAIYGI